MNLSSLQGGGMKRSSFPLMLLVLLIISIFYCNWSTPQIIFACSAVGLILYCISPLLKIENLVERILIIISQKRDRNKNNNSVSFNDVIAKEIMRIRYDVVSMQVKLDDRGWNKISKDFLQLFWIYKDYRSCFLCGYLSKPDDYSGSTKYQGKIIICLANDIDIDEDFHIEFNVETLMELHAFKERELKKEMHLNILISEENIFKSTYAKILSIKKDERALDLDYVIILEIDMSLRNMFGEVREENLIIRKLEISQWASNVKIITD